MSDVAPSMEQEDEFDQDKPLTSQGKNPQDVFALTGTTFAGATSMNSTAGPTDTRPSTEGGGMMDMGMQARPGEEAESTTSTARHSRLLIEAELRAAHQAEARATMLALAKALEESNEERRRLAGILRNQSDTATTFEDEISGLKEEIARLHEECEIKDGEILRAKAVKSGNKMIFGMMIEKAKDGDFYGGDGSPEEYAYSGKEKEEQAVRRASLAGAPPPDLAAGLGVQAGGPGGAGASRDLVGAGAGGETRDMTSAFANACMGDKVTIKWAVHLWQQQVADLREENRKEREEAERKRREEEYAKRLAEARERAKAEFMKQIQDLESQLDRARTQIDELNARNGQTERELQFEKEKAAREAAAAKKREEALQAELEETNENLTRTRASLQEMTAEYEKQVEALRLAEEAFAEEKRQLQATIRKIQSELQEALVLAKHLREVCLKAKRDASGSVSPAKFAELIAQLEEMRNSLGILQKDCLREKDANALLLRNLDKNKRQLELERQFLPLLRKVRGPVGPKAKGTEEGTKKKDPGTLQASQSQSTMLPLPSGASPQKLRASQSAGALTGGPLPGGRSAGFQNDMKRFSSSLGGSADPGAELQMWMNDG